MAVAHDANTRFPSTDGTTGVNSVDTTTGDRTFSHAGAATAQGAVVTVLCTGNTTTITGVLYGGVAMTIGPVANDTTEAGRVEIYTLVAGVPTGTQTVTLQGCTATAKWATCSTVTAAGQVSVVGERDKDTTVAVDPNVTLDTGALSMAYGGCHQGNAAPATAGITAASTVIHSNDYGALSANTFRSTDPTAAGTFAVGVDLGSDDHCVAAIAFGEQQAFPTTGVLDSFNRADGVLGANWTAEPFNDGSTAFSLVSNTAMGEDPTNSGDGSYWNVTTFGPATEAWIEMPIHFSTLGENGVLLRVAGPSASANTGDGYQAFMTAFSPSGARYDFDLSHYRWDNAVATLLGAAQTGLSFRAGDGFGARMVGSLLQAYVGTGTNWRPVGSSRTDATYTAAGFIGMTLYEDTRTTTINNFGGGTYVGWPRQSRRSAVRRPALTAPGSFN